MAIAIIKHYLEDKNRTFDMGAVLYHRYGTNSVFKKLLAQTPNAYTRAKLIEELEKLSKLEEIPSKTTEHVAPSTAPTPKNQFVRHVLPVAPRLENLPEDLKLLRQKITTNDKEAALLHKQLSDTNASEVNKHFAAKILMLKEANFKYWEEINAYNSNQLYDKPEVNFQKQLTNLRSNISKVKKKLDAAPQNEKLAWQSKLDEYEARKAEILKNIN